MDTESGLTPFIGPSFFLLDMGIKSTAILVAALLMTRVLRQASASVRHYIWIVAIFSCLALPVINVCVPKWTIETFVLNHPAAPLSDLDTTQTMSANSITSPVSRPPVNAIKSSEVSFSEMNSKVRSRPGEINVSHLKSDMTNNISIWLIPIAALLSVLWLTGVVLMLLRLAIMCLRLRAVSCECEVMTQGPLYVALQKCREDLNCSQSVRLLVTESDAMPMTWGIRLFSILLPRQAEFWPEKEVRCALLHELAHVARRDCLSQLLVQMTCALYWFHPLVWLAARNVFLERELACDDIVLRNGTRASDYAAQLMQVVSRFQSNRRMNYMTVSMASRNGFTQRLKAILHESQDRRPVRLRTMVSLAISFLTLASLLGIFQIALTRTATAQQADTKQNSKPQLLERPAIQQSLAKPQKKNELKSIPVAPNSPFSLSGQRSGLVPGGNQPAIRSLNIVFAHDPGIGNYDGIVGRPNDVWNSVDIGTTAVDYTRYSDASPSTARLRISRHDGEWGIKGLSGIFQGYIYHNCRCVDLETKVLDLPAGKYKIYVFAHGDAPNQNAEIELKVGKRVVGRKATANDGTWDYRTQPYREGLQYVSFDFTIKAGQELTLISHRAGSDYSMFNAIQIVPFTEPNQQQLNNAHPRRLIQR